MKIQDLFENIPTTISTEGDKLPFDLADDLLFFMRNDDNFYRKHFYPHVVKCIGHSKQGRDLSPKVFEPMVRHAYECYTNKFPIRQLPDSLDEAMCEKICDQLRKEENKHIKNSIY